VAITLDQRETTCTLKLEGVLDIGSAKELKASLVQALETGKELCLELERTSSLDVTAVQLLWAFVQDAKRSSLALGVTGPVPEEVSIAFRDAGLETFFLPTPDFERPQSSRQSHSNG
jgi:anti-anti-sigma factor